MHRRPPWMRTPSCRGHAWPFPLTWLVAALLLAGCQRDSESGEAQGPEAEQAAVQDSGAQAATDPASTAEPTPPPQAAPLPDTTPPATAADSLAATLTGIMVVQERILARLDSMEAALPAAGAESAAPVDETGGIDLEEARDEVTNLGLGIFWSIVVLAIFHFAIRAVIWILETMAERSVTQRLTFKWLIPITRMLLWGVAAYLIVRTIFGITAQGLLAASAALGVALGFAAQDLLKNVFGGLIVVFDQPFQVGDKIRVGGTYGEVVSIGLRSTRIVTADDDSVSVPNSQVVEEQVANANTGKLNCQVVTNLYLPGRVDERKAR